MTFTYIYMENLQGKKGHSVIYKTAFTLCIPHDCVITTKTVSDVEHMIHSKQCAGIYLFPVQYLHAPKHPSSTEESLSSGPALS